MQRKNKVVNTKKSLISKLIILGVLIIILILMMILRNYRDFSESYSKNVLSIYELIFGSITSFFPFSIFEVFVISTIVYVIMWFIFFIKNTIKKGIKNTYHTILRFMIIFLSIFTLYQSTAGIEYGRQPLTVPQHTELVDDVSKYKEICKTFLDDFNYCASQLEFNEQGSVVKPYSNNALQDKMIKEYELLDFDYLYSYTPRAKPMYFTGWFYRAMNISGVNFTPTGEANYNVLCPDGYLPFTIAHELAHAKGVMPEENANLVAAYLCLSSDDPYIRYSGHNVTFWSLFTFARALNNDDEYNEFARGVDSRIYKNNQYEYEYWKEHATFEKISDWFNDLYLKMQNDVGTVSYSDNIDTTQTETEFVINSYSRYQALYLWFYFDK